MSDIFRNASIVFVFIGLATFGIGYAQYHHVVGEHERQEDELVRQSRNPTMPDPDSIFEPLRQQGFRGSARVVVQAVIDWDGFYKRVEHESEQAKQSWRSYRTLSTQLTAVGLACATIAALLVFPSRTVQPTSVSVAVLAEDSITDVRNEATTCDNTDSSRAERSPWALFGLVGFAATLLVAICLLQGPKDSSLSPDGDKLGMRLRFDGLYVRNRAPNAQILRFRSDGTVQYVSVSDYENDKASVEWYRILESGRDSRDVGKYTVRGSRVKCSLSGSVFGDGTFDINGHLTPESVLVTDQGHRYEFVKVRQ